MFTAALTLHILAGLTCVVAGTLAATARKQPGHHPRSGQVYLWGLSIVVTTATVMSILRWPHNAHLFAIAVVTGGLALFGWQARRRQRPGWMRWHAIGMGGSLITLLTGFYVDNGARLPGWKLLPHWSYWVIPAAVGVPLIWWALRRATARSAA